MYEILLVAPLALTMSRQSRLATDPVDPMGTHARLELSTRRMRNRPFVKVALQFMTGMQVCQAVLDPGVQC